MGQRLVLTIKDSRLSKETEDDFRDEDRDKNNLMKIYYHWSGYTKSTQQIMYDIVDVIRRAEELNKSQHELLLDIIKHVEKCDEETKATMTKMFPNYDRTCCGGIDGGPNLTKYNPDTQKYEVTGPNPEWDYITKLFPEHRFNEHPDRNDGLIAMTEKGMADVQGWSEGDAVIDLGTGECYNDTVWGYEYDEYVDNRVNNWDDSKEDAEKELESAYKGDSNPFEFNYKDDADFERSKVVFDDYCRSGCYVFNDIKDKTVYETIE